MTPIEKLQRVVELASKATPTEEIEGRVKRVLHLETNMDLLSRELAEMLAVIRRDRAFRTSAPSMARALLVLLPALEKADALIRERDFTAGTSGYTVWRHWLEKYGDALASAKKELSDE